MRTFESLSQKIKNYYELLSARETFSDGPGGDRPTLQQYASDFLTFDYFTETHWERDFDDFMTHTFLDGHSADADGLLNKYTSENVIAIPPKFENPDNDSAIVKFEIAIGHGLANAKSLYKGIIEDISRDDTIASSKFLKLLLANDQIYMELADYTEIKATQAGLDPDEEWGEDTIIHLLSGIDNVTLFKRYVFDLDNEGDPGFPDNSRYHGRLIDLEDFFGALMLDAEFEEIRTEVDDLLEGGVIDGGERYATMNTGYNLDAQKGFQETESHHLKEIVKEIASATQTYVEETAQEEWDIYREDPVDYLEGMGHEHQYHYEEQYGPIEDHYERDDQETMYELMYEYFPNFMNKYSSGIKFEKDMSLSPDPHTEFSQDDPPYITGLKEGLEYLETFFAEFENQDNFTMDRRTGLHTNIGYLTEEEEPERDYNLIKALLFLNHEFASKGFESRQHSQWAGDIKKRSIEDIASLLSRDVATKAAGRKGSAALEDFVKKDFDKVEDTLSSVISSMGQRIGSKSLGFNINHISGRKYIEFRYPGHGELNFESMKDATLYYAHIVKLSTDPEYKKREYMKKLIGFVNNLKHVELEKVKSFDNVRALKKGDLIIAGESATWPLIGLYKYLTSEAEQEAGRRPDMGRGSETIKPRSLGQDFYIYKGLDAKSKSVILESIKSESPAGVTWPNYAIEEERKPLVSFERQMKRGGYTVWPSHRDSWRASPEGPLSRMSATSPLYKVVMGMFEVVRQGVKGFSVFEYNQNSDDIWNLRSKLQGMQHAKENNLTWQWGSYSEEDREMYKKYEGKDFPTSPPDEEQQELRQVLRKIRTSYEEDITPEEPPERASDSDRPRPDEQRHGDERRPRIPPVNPFEEPT